MNNKTLINRAITSMNNSYSPYSKFSVGACLVTGDGDIFDGCNIENASYSMAICAERVVFSKAISAGKRSFKKIIIVGGKNKKITDFCMPCGACRQFMREFCSDDFEIIVAKSTDDYILVKLGDLLPSSFSSKDLQS